MTLRNGMMMIGLLGLGVATTSLAGKPERDKAAELKPKIASVTAGVKAACGCANTINVKWDGFPRVEEMAYVNGTLEDIDAATKAQCGSAEDKKVYCDHVTGYEISYATEGTAKLSGKTILLTTNMSSHPGDHLITGIIGKF